MMKTLITISNPDNEVKENARLLAKDKPLTRIGFDKSHVSLYGSQEDIAPFANRYKDKVRKESRISTETDHACVILWLSKMGENNIRVEEKEAASHEILERGV